MRDLKFSGHANSSLGVMGCDSHHYTASLSTTPQFQNTNPFQIYKFYLNNFVGVIFNEIKGEKFLYTL
jgi:hypothetical protein